MSDVYKRGMERPTAQKKKLSLTKAHFLKQLVILSIQNLYFHDQIKHLIESSYIPFIKTKICLEMTFKTYKINSLLACS